MIAIIDYGVGNLGSVKNALDYLALESIITSDKNIILKADKVILPGVGAFKKGMELLKEKGLDKVVLEVTKNKTPLLGICLGMQMLFDDSCEYGLTEGLHLIPGHVKAFGSLYDNNHNTLKVPHVGWNTLDINHDSKLLTCSHNRSVYFVHSYYVETKEEYISAQTTYGLTFTSAVEKDNIMGCQFHPEKSGMEGLAILAKFGAL